MGSPVGLLRLKAATGINPNPNSGCVSGQIRLSSDTKSVGKGGDSCLWGRKNFCVIDEDRVRRAVFEESWIRIFKLSELRLDGFC